MIVNFDTYINENIQNKPHRLVYKNPVKDSYPYNHSVILGDEYYYVNFKKDKPFTFKYKGKINRETYRPAGRIVTPSKAFAIIINDKLANKNLKEYLDYSDALGQVRQDFKNLRLNDDGYAAPKANDILMSLITKDEQKYHDIIEIIKLQNEVDTHYGKSSRPKFTNLEYLNRKPSGTISVIRDKWEKIKQKISDEETK